jgi:hypothetical protein
MQRGRKHRLCLAARFRSARGVVQCVGVLSGAVPAFRRNILACRRRCCVRKRANLRVAKIYGTSSKLICSIHKSATSKYANAKGTHNLHMHVNILRTRECGLLSAKRGARGIWGSDGRAALAHTPPEHCYSCCLGLDNASAETPISKSTYCLRRRWRLVWPEGWRQC